jgi:predicted choloylglycine hydrolase
VIRYVLEVCENVESACVVLLQVPVHAAQNVTLLDLGGDFATVRLSPEREPLVQAFLEEPLYRDGSATGFGTLDTAVYFPATGRAEYRWPDNVMMTQSCDEAKERL